MAVIFSNEGQWDKAALYFNHSIASNPQNALSYLNLAALQDRFGNYKLAFDNYSLAIKFNPYFAQAYHNRAIIDGRRGQLSLAIQDLSKAIEIIPETEFIVDRSLNGDRFHAATGYKSPEWQELIELMHAHQ